MLRAAATALLTLAIGAAPAHANEIWVAPTYQQDIGLGVGSNVAWPTTSVGAVRLAWAIPGDLETFQSARLVLIPEAASAASTLTVYVCRAAGGQLVTAACTGPHTTPFSSTANQLLELDISAGVAPQVGTPGANHLTVLAFTTPTIATDRILGLRVAYDPVHPDGAATLGANTFTGTQTAPAFVGNGAGLTNVAKLGANTFGGTQTAPSFAGSGTALTGVAKLTANTFTATQRIRDGNLDLALSTATEGNITKLGQPFLHDFGLSTFLGFRAGNLTMTGINNVGIGTRALESITTSLNNVGVGDGALALTTSGGGNTAVGNFTLEENVGGVDNVAVGMQAMRRNVSGVGNVAVGPQALMDNMIAGDNTAVGRNALVHTLGFNNTALGSGAGADLTNGDNNIYIRNRGGAVESNTIRIGNIQTKTFIQGIRGITTGVNNAVPVLVDSLGQLGTVSSSRRYKEDIHDMGGVSSRLLQLRPVTFRYTQAFSDGAKPVQFGLIAEEVAEAFPELVVRDDEGRPETVAYQNLSVLLLNELQRLQRERLDDRRALQAERARIDALERELAARRLDRRH
jgi:hypothetical protein